MRLRLARGGKGLAVPRATAMDAPEWATIVDPSAKFEPEELNRVVRESASIELARRERDERRSWFGKFLVAASYVVMICGLVVSGIAFLMVLRVRPEEFEAGLQIFCAAGFLMGCLTVLHWWVDWLTTPYRQWSRTILGIAAMEGACAVGSLAALYARLPELSDRWLLMIPMWLLLLLAIASVPLVFRCTYYGKPPAVELESLTPTQIEYLIAYRRKALKVLRSRSIVSYVLFNELDQSPLT
ncbi:MAG: hypothetical protein HOV77_06140 [Hamadaea sp.]|uniref:hypothetical protein n=1 Tax=Hamadaea sp. TaxID=2024425 RepID=UPI001806541D|nr:hypothetical protein [Hamadaea sp.]NUT18746.1 hypothetical protein [Hamadaea sp.]